MSSADRVSELLDKWLTSLELHAQYAQLSDLAYSCVQPWPKHDRPTRWVVQIAREKALLLKQHCQARHAAGDEQFAESLELMLTLANLVGLQHIQRFIPLADPARAQPLPAETPANTPDFSALVQAEDEATEADSAMTEPTRELPQLKLPVSAARAKTPVTKPTRMSTAQRVKDTTAAAITPDTRLTTNAVLAGSVKPLVATSAASTAVPALAGAARSSTAQRSHPAPAAAAKAMAAISSTEGSASYSTTTNVTASVSSQTIAADPVSDTQEMPRPTNPPMPATKVPTRNAAPAVAASAEPAALSPAEHIVITDAIRFLKWGKPWHELAELVSRIADRPGITQVRRILRTHRADIEARAGAE